MNVTVIVPAQNAKNCIEACVNSLFCQSYKSGDIQVVVVDDGSRDDTAVVARNAGAEVVSIPAMGPAGARNRGVAISRGEILLFTDSDCVPELDWVEKMTLPFEDANVIGTKGIYRTDQKSLTARFVQLEYESRYERMKKLSTIDFVDTYSAGFRRDLFLKVGSFDESFPSASVEDQEFSFRYSRLPGKILFIEEAVVLHSHADNPLRYFRKKLKIGFWKTRVLVRHPGKIISDSHTPKAVKVEMTCVLASLAATPLVNTRIGFWFITFTQVCFILCSFPFASRIFKKDWKVGCVASMFLFVRALALGLGTSVGAFSIIPSLFRKPFTHSSKDIPELTIPPHGKSEREPQEEEVKEEVHELV